MLPTRAPILFALLLATAIPALPQEVLNNDSIIKMVKARIDDQIIINLMRTRPGQYDTDSKSLVHLAENGVSSRIIEEIIALTPYGAKPAPSELPGSKLIRSTPGGHGLCAEPGVNYKKGGSWVPLPPEQVDWDAAGDWKRVASWGTWQQDINGRVFAPHSANVAKLPLEITICGPAGATSADYRLLRLRSKKSSREFRVKSGRLLSRSDDSKRDVLQLELKDQGERAFACTVPADLGPGEYGIVHWKPAETSTARDSRSLPILTVYTFRVTP